MDTPVRKTKTKHYSILGTLICVTLLSLGYFSDPPNGYTGAPGDDLCTECHTLNGGMQNGTLILNGLPSTIVANQTYTLSVTIVNPNGIGELAGFQSIVLNDNDQNAGTFSNPSNGSTIESQGSRMYHEHTTAAAFPMSNAVVWSVNWTAPEGDGTITFYASGNVANGNDEDSGDLIITNSVSGTLFTPVQVSISDINHVTCFGENDGSITAQAMFGTGPYNYNWSTGGSGATITNLAAETYTVTVTDNTGATSTASGEVEQPDLFEIESFTVNDVLCNSGNTGSIVLVLTGGTPPYTGAQGDVFTLSNLVANDYTVSVIDANGCLVEEDFTVSEPEALNIEVQVVIEPECFGEENGLITVEASGGTGALEYIWSNGGTMNTIQNLEGGVYSVTVLDENGCSTAETIILNAPDEITIDLVNLSDVSCAGEADGEISIDADGGSGILEYEWSDGSTDPTITDLEGGIYGVTVTDDNGCTSEDEYEIVEPAELDCEIMGDMSLACFGDDNGVLVADVDGGAGGFTFEWSTGDDGMEIDGLVAGTYTVTVTDENGCTVVVSATITQPTQLLANATSTGETGPGEMDGTATAAPTGGTSPYTYLWSNGQTTSTITGLAVGTYTVTVTDQAGCTAVQTVAVSGVNCTLIATVMTTNVGCNGDSTGSAEVVITGATGPVTILWSNGESGTTVDDLSAGQYSVMVNDTAGCIAAVDFEVTEPDPLSVILTVTGETMEGANDGSIVATVSGGTPPYTYEWSNGDTGAVIVNLAPGSYTVTITDGNGCTFGEDAFVPSFECAILVTVTTLSPSCFGGNDGAANISITGGTAPYTIIWSNGDTGGSADSLSAGGYTLTVTDADDCVIESSFTVNETPAITVSVDTIIPWSQVQDGAINVTITGGTPPYTIVWTLNGGLISTNEDIAGLDPGEYVLEVIDANECVLTGGTLTVAVLTGTKDVEGELNVTLFPNPASDEVLIQSESEIQRIDMYDTRGLMIRRLEEKDLLKGAKGYSISTDDLTTGLYYISVLSADGRKVLPFVKG